ncbi:MAG: hypothetical protein SFW67_30730 [Myxococcaceae bacterium]|nr:hypothetical protein [Myxococcaceae bacterium]
MSTWTIDTSQWPIVIHSVEGSLNDRQIDDYLREATALMDRPESYVAIMDASRIGSVSAYMRARITEWQRQHRAIVNERCLGVVYVLASPLLRFVTMTILLVTGLGVPYVVCATRDEALAWARGRASAVMPT